MYGNNGNGGLLMVTKLAKMFGEYGMVKVNLTDQLVEGKKWGNQTWNFLVPVNLAGFQVPEILQKKSFSLSNGA